MPYSQLQQSSERGLAHRMNTPSSSFFLSKEYKVNDYGRRDARNRDARFATHITPACAAAEKAASVRARLRIARGGTLQYRHHPRRNIHVKSRSWFTPVTPMYVWCKNEYDGSGLVRLNCQRRIRLWSENPANADDAKRPSRRNADDHFRARPYEPDFPEHTATTSPE